MAEFHGHVAAVVEVALGSETSAAAVTTDTLVPVAETADFVEGSDVLIDGEVYAVVDVDDGETSGVPSITLASGLVADVAEASRVDVWDSVTGTKVPEWLATVTDDTDGSAMEDVPLTHALIALLGADVRGLVGESVVARQDDAEEWWVVEVIGATPGYDPYYIRTGTLAATTTIIAGTEGGKRVQMDGTGTPAFEAYDASNNQTVNIDGEANYIEGTLATAASGPRVVLGPGVLLGDPTNDVRLETAHADEISPAVVRSRTASVDVGVDVGAVEIVGPDWDGDAETPPYINLQTGSTVSSSNVSIKAHDIALQGSASVSGTLAATMSTGSVGTGTFRDSVDARVTAVGGGAYQPLDSDLTAIAALSTTSFGRALLALADSAALAAQVAASTTSAAGVVELATSAETTTGTDTVRAVTPAGAKALLDTINSTSLGHIERTADATQTMVTYVSGTVPTVLFQTSTVAGRGGISYSSGQFTVTNAGRYIVNAVVSYSSNTSGRRLVQITQNGTTRKSSNQSAPVAGNSVTSITGVFDCAASDVIEIRALQDSGSTLTVQAATNVTITNLGS